jgi:uncharacterized ferritin-like protein (DUF455 family)
MELRAFAEQILFATTLEEKLRCPANLTDDQPGPPLIAPATPGRPTELRFKPTVSGKADFPGVHQLNQPRERGRLLHFFANHELLATELMALVLLRFPDAPAAFRKGVLQTLKDEQEHTRLYLERMKACGIHFGELPVSGYFWRTVSVMENPLDYVSSLCLTFEQANLDFARHFARGFATVGDEATAKLLEKIYRDEIGHVAYGLKWFRRWKNPGASDWEAFCRQLKFPLSPQRAKGITLNIEGRRAAGFDPQFIAELDVYSQSKGRTPGVFVFNPFAEGRLAEGRAFNPTKHQAQLARDLANLPQFLCRQDDLVLIGERPSVEFLSSIKQAGFALPEFVEIGWRAGHHPGRPKSSAVSVRDSLSSPKGGEGRGEEALFSKLPSPQPSPRLGGEREKISQKHGPGISALCHRKLGALRPWAWGPDSFELFKPLFENVTVGKRTASQHFNEGIARLYSKAWSAALLRKILPGSSRREEAHSSKSPIANRQSPNQNWLCTEDEIGTVVNTLAEALAAIAAIRGRGHHRIVVKEALGLAGSNALRLFEPELLEPQRRWLANALANHRQLVVEPWLERELDFSVQLEMTSDGLKLCGYTGLLNDAKGQFQGNWAESHHHTRIPAKVVALFREPPDISRRLLNLYADIFALLEAELRRVDYLGPLGIDAFVYRDSAGWPRLKPIVEINPRYTMGRVTVELMRQTCQGSFGWFRLISRRMAQAEGFSDFPAYARSLSERFPLQLEGEPAPRIREGAVCLNDPAQAQVCLAVFLVSRSMAEPAPFLAAPQRSL